MRWRGTTAAQRRARGYRGFETFSYLPTQLEDGSWVWLEPYWTVNCGSEGWKNFPTEEALRDHFRVSTEGDKG